MIGEYNCLCKLEIITSVIELNLVHGANGKAWWNSNKQNAAMQIENTSNLCEYMFSNCRRTGICFYAIPSTIKVENGSPDGNGGFGIAYKSTSEDYGMLIVFSYGKAVYMKIKSITWGNWKKVKFIEWLFYIK